MKPEFRLVVNVEEFTDEQLNAIYEAGFDDSHWGRNDITVDDREGELEQLIREAIGQVQKAGLSVVRVELAGANVVDRINAELGDD